MKYVIVFDIDVVLAHQDLRDDEEMDLARSLHPDSPVTTFEHDRSKVMGFWLPYMDVLFDYLMKFDSRIVIFSSSIEERNVSIINQALTQVYGEDKYRDLLEKGQFKILSKQHLRPGDRERKEFGNFIKDLTIVVQNGEDIENAILIEDQPSYAAHDQVFCIKSFDLEEWCYTASPNSRHSFRKNGTYYLLGLFKEYFENKKYSDLSLRAGLKTMFEEQHGKIHDKGIYYPSDYFYIDDRGESSHVNAKFTTAMLDSGLAEVQKKYPEASFYGTELMKK